MLKRKKDTGHAGVHPSFTGGISAKSAASPGAKREIKFRFTKNL
jgi:hypothetical protein